MSDTNGKLSNTSDALHETAARGVEAIHAIVQQRDELLASYTRAQADLALYKERNTQLDMRLSQATAERDHYMRYCTELTTRLTNIQVLISTTVEEAKRAAYKPTRVVKQSQLDAADQQQLEQLIAKLPNNTTSDNGQTS
jgi:hypothetical protein